jgi:hypothetical protein
MISDNRSVMCFNLIFLWDRLDDMGAMVDEVLAMDLPAPVVRGLGPLLAARCRCQLSASAPSQVGRRFKFEDMQNALREFQSGATVGKVVVAL